MAQTTVNSFSKHCDSVNFLLYSLQYSNSLLLGLPCRPLNLRSRLVGVHTCFSLTQNIMKMQVTWEASCGGQLSGEIRSLLPLRIVTVPLKLISQINTETLHFLCERSHICLTEIKVFIVPQTHFFIFTNLVHWQKDYETRKKHSSFQLFLNSEGLKIIRPDNGQELCNSFTLWMENVIVRSYSHPRVTSVNC